MNYCNEFENTFSTLCNPCPYEYDCEKCKKETEKYAHNSQTQRMDDFKRALKFCIDNSRTTAKTELIREILDILYASAYGDGQQYMLERIESEKNND